MQCQECKRDIPDDALLCPYCGVAVESLQGQTAEEVYLSSPNATVTKTRAIIADKTYTMGLIGSVEMATVKPNQTVPSLLILAGIVMAVVWFTVREGMAFCGVIGVLLVLIGIVSSRYRREQHAVRVTSASGEVDALLSEDKESIQTVVDAINRAITERG